MVQQQQFYPVVPSLNFKFITKDKNMKKLYTITFAVLLSGLNDNLLHASEQISTVTSQAVPAAITATLLEPTISSAIQVAIANELSNDQLDRLAVINENIGHTVTLFCEFIIPNNNPNSIDDSIKISKSYQENSVSHHDVRKFAETSLHAAKTVYKALETEHAQLIENKKHLKEQQAIVEQTLSTIANPETIKTILSAIEGPFANPKRWTKFTGNSSHTFSSSISVNHSGLPSVHLPMESVICFNPEEFSVHDFELMTAAGRAIHELEAERSCYLLRTNFDQVASLKKFQEQFNVDADKLEKDVTGKLRNQRSKLDSATIKFKKIQEALNPRNEDGSLKELD